MAKPICVLLNYTECEIGVNLMTSGVLYQSLKLSSPKKLNYED